MLFELKNLASEFNSLKAKGNLINDDNEEKLVTIEEENKTQITTSQDPNMESNPSMKVLGVVKETQGNQENQKN